MHLITIGTQQPQPACIQLLPCWAYDKHVHPASCAAAAGYLLIPIIGVVLGLSNLFGYFKCSKDAKKQLQSMTANMATNAMTSAMTGRLQAAFARV